MPEEPADGYSTIWPGTEYAMRLLNAPQDDRIIAALARIKCENDAIDAFVNNIVRLVAPENRDASRVTSLVMRDGFLVDFSGVVIPEVKEGLLHEGYRREEIKEFAKRLASLAELAHTCLIKEDAEEEAEGNARLADYRQFLTVLVAGLIYGPNHPRARLDPGPTQEYLCYPGEEDEALDGAAITLTQIYDGRGFRTGYSAHYSPQQAIFIGRSTNLEEYVKRCEGVLDAETLKGLQQREQIIFPVADTHESVSRWQGVLLCENAWRLFELGSTNGTSLKRTYVLDALGERATDENVQVEGFMEVRPGDRLRFGAPVDAEDPNVYRDAATLLLTAYVNPVE